MRTCVKSLILALTLLASVSMPASAGVIGMWNGSARSWNDPDFSSVRALMQAAGNTVRPDQDLITALTGADLLVIAEPNFAPNASELTALTNWVTTGGVLLLAGDSAGTGAVGNNAITAALGSSLHEASDFVFLAGTIQGGVFATTGPPNNIVGQQFTSTPASTITGGNEVQDSLVRWQQIGTGFVFLMGDRLDHNVNMAPGGTNFQFFENLANRAANGTPPVAAVPEPATVVLIGGGLLALLRQRVRGN